MSAPLVSLRGLRVALPDRSAKRPFAPAPLVEIVKGIDLDIARGRALGLVGESGSGKTTLGRTLVRLLKPTAGELSYDGRDIGAMEERELRPLREKFQMIFQNPQSSLNPRLRIASTLSRPLEAFGKFGGRAGRRRRTAELMEIVGLPAAFLDRYPHELSGGQRQRVGIARALALEPEFIVADEIVSGLDVSTQAQILLLLRRLRAEFNLTLVFISHDLSVVRVLCDDVAVMSNGEIVEKGATAAVFAAPKHSYTRELLDSVPLPDIDREWMMAEKTKPTPLPVTWASSPG
jgi:peptide/nickel transport system ATP-binding protein